MSRTAVCSLLLHKVCESAPARVRRRPRRRRRCRRGCAGTAPRWAPARPPAAAPPGCRAASPAGSVRRASPPPSPRASPARPRARSRKRLTYSLGMLSWKAEFSLLSKEGQLREMVSFQGRSDPSFLKDWSLDRLDKKEGRLASWSIAAPLYLSLGPTTDLSPALSLI